MGPFVTQYQSYFSQEGRTIVFSHIIALLIVAVLSLQVLAVPQWPTGGESFHINPPGDISHYLTYGLGSLWMTDPNEDKIWRIDPSTGTVQDSLDSSWGGGIAFDGEYLWKALYSGPIIRRIRLSDGATVREIPGVGTEQAGLAWDGTYLWIADRSTQRIYRLNPNTGAQISSFDSPGPYPRGLVWWNGYLYHTDSHEDTIYQLDPTTGEIISRIAAPSYVPRGLAFDGTSFWHSDLYQGINRMAIDVSPDGRIVRSSPSLMMAEMTYSVTNTGGSTIDSLEAHWLFPAQDENHILIQRTFDPPPDSYTTNEFGEVSAQFSSFPALAPGATQHIVCRSYEQIWRVNYQVDPGEVGPLSSIPQDIKDRYLADYSTLHITEPEIVAAAVDAVGGETNPYLMAVRIHDYVAEHMIYDKEAGTPQDALETLRAGRGVCGNYAILFTALGRAVGLPIRFVAGFYYYKASESAGDHGWVEAYIPGYEWIPFDATGDDRSPIRHLYAGCEPLEIIFYRGGGTCVAGPCGKWLGWDTHGVPYSTQKTFRGASPLCVSSLDAYSGALCGTINLSWENPPASDLTRIAVRRTTQRYPASQVDGVLVYQTAIPTPEATVSTVDSGLSPQERYFYTVFAESSTGLWNSMVVQGENADEAYPSAAGTASVFRITKEGNVHADGAYYGADFQSGTGADIAEYIGVSESVEPGDVVELDPDRPGYYRKSRSPYSTLASGVISTRPGVTMGSQSNVPTSSASPKFALSNLDLESLHSTHYLSLGSLLIDNPAPSLLVFNISLSELEEALNSKPLLALMGIVPVKATNENGPIKPGDLLTTSSTPGYAMRCDDPKECEGAIIGKALESLEEGKGIIKMLVMR